MLSAAVASASAARRPFHTTPRAAGSATGGSHAAGHAARKRSSFIAVKPSIARWKNVAKVREANKLIAEQCAKDPKRLVFLDIDPLMIGANGEPDPALFVKDGLHMSPAGYEKWTAKLLPHLELK